MSRRITGFHQDDEGHWVAELECGHTQHVRHDPPWQVRPWVVEHETREARIGSSLPCRACDEQAASPGLSYEDAKVCGLCEDGAEEVARGNGEPVAPGDSPPPELTITEDGLTVTSANDALVIPWGSIRRLAAFKADLGTHDQVVLVVDTSVVGEPVLLPEGLAGFSAIFAALEQHLGVAPAWYMDIMAPAFEATPLLLFERS